MKLGIEVTRKELCIQCKWTRRNFNLEQVKPKIPPRRISYVYDNEVWLTNLFYRLSYVLWKRVFKISREVRGVTKFGFKDLCRNVVLIWHSHGFVFWFNQKFYFFSILTPWNGIHIEAFILDPYWRIDMNSLKKRLLYGINTYIWIL